MKESRLFRYIADRSPKRGFDGTVPMPAELLESPTFVRRLSYKGMSPDVGARSSLAETIASAPADVCFFLDTSMWDSRLEPELWEALTDTAADVFVTASVRLELEAWLAKNAEHPGAEAVLSDDGPLIQLPPADWDSPDEQGLVYYIKLLHVRRQAFVLLGAQFFSRHGRAPTEQELLNSVVKACGQRGLGLVHKDGKHQQGDKYATDEGLVCTAARNALVTGRESIVLTKDHDVMEQFYKLWWFLDTHYRAMLLADAYVQDPLAFSHSAFSGDTMSEMFFEDEDAMLVSMGTDRMDRYLPRDFTFVPASCMLVGPGLSRLTFGAETEMSRLLAVKGRTGGLVSESLRGRNLHAWLAPLRACVERPDAVLIARGKTVPYGYGSLGLSSFDVWHAVNSRERFSVPVPASGLLLPPWAPGAVD